MINFDDFKKIELKVAKIISAEKIEGKDKLLKVQINLGSEERQIVSGIAEYYSPESLVGKEIIVVANLEPRIFGEIESNGMLLATSDNGKIVLLAPESEVAPGSKIS